MFDLTAALDARRAQDLYRTRLIVDSPQGVEIESNGRRLLSFCANDYLGLANDARVVEAMIDGARQYGAGSGAAHLISGHSRAHHQLEEDLAALTQRDRALVFSTGFMANTGAVTALLSRRDHVFEDRLNHASLIDAGLQSGAHFHRYAHADAIALARLLGRADSGNKLVVTDGVFSMDGDIAPLPEIARVCRERDAWLMVDDAHGFGVLGEHGGGCAEHYNLTQRDVPVLMGTFGKAFGTFGAFIAGSESLIEYLIQFARPYIFTTALPPAVAAATRAAVRIAQDEPWRREHLRALVQYFRDHAASARIPLMPSSTPIQPVLIGDAARAKKISQQLLEKNIFVPAIRPPTVPPHTARLRVTFSAAHTIEHVDRLLDALQSSACCTPAA